jgi:hypothetical protein
MMAVVAMWACGCGPSTGEETSGTDGESEGTSASEEFPACVSPDPDQSLTVAISPSVDALATTPCTVDALTGNGGTTISIALSCDATTIEIDIEVEPAVTLALAPGDAVVMESSDDPSFAPSRRSVWLRDPQREDVLLAVVDATGPAWMQELAPLEVVPVAGACPEEPTQDECWTGQRVVFDVSHEGDTARIADGGRATIGPYVVHLQESFDGVLLQCTDLPGEFYRALIARSA